jgi:hypothetical protein
MTHLLLHKTPNSVSSEPGAAHPRKAKGKKSKKLSPAKKAAAKRTAKKAGRKYPSLVDNMRAASSKKTRAKTKSRKKPAKSKR